MLFNIAKIDIPHLASDILSYLVTLLDKIRLILYNYIEYYSGGLRHRIDYIIRALHGATLGEVFMLKIVRCTHPSSVRGAFCSQISEIIDNGGRAVLIVPEQQTVMAEALMARVLPPASVLRFEVTNFTRLANTTFRTLGGLTGEYCDTAKKHLIMWRTLTELSPTLSMTDGRRDIGAGMVDASLAAVAQMQNSGIRPSDLADTASHEGLAFDSRLAAKLKDLASIYSLYKKLLGERYADTGDDAEMMIKKLRENPDFLSDTAVFIEGFTSFTEPQYRLIGILSERSTVTVGLTLPNGCEAAFEYTEIIDCQGRLDSAARKEGSDIKLLREEGFATRRNESLDEVCSLLWSGYKPNDKICLQNKDDLRIFEAATPYEECAFVAEDIRRRVMGGASYSDIAIVARGVDNHRGILDGALADAGVPAFLSYRRDINEFEAIKLIYSAYAVTRGFNREDVISYSKCALSGVSREECDEFEGYVNLWQINGSRFTDEGVWNMNPDGYSIKRREGTDEKLLRIHGVRQRIVRPLVALGERAAQATTVREQAGILLDFLLEIDLEGSLIKRAEDLAAMGEGELAEHNSTLWRMICGALDTLVTVLDDAPCDAEAFLSQLKVVFSACDVGRIPSYVDQVTVGSADMLRLYEKKHVYLIGVNAGAFPANISDNSYFTERDKRKLSECGLALDPELEIKGARELYIFSRAFSYATDSVTLSYSAADTRFKAIEPSAVIKRIGELTGGDVKPIRIDTIPFVDRVYSPAQALSMVGGLSDGEYNVVRSALIDADYGREVAVCEGDISNTTARLGTRIVADDKSLVLSQSKIDKYVDCPFMYFCKYLIKLTREERAEFDSRNIGSFIHAILENFFATLSEQGRKSGELTAEERASLTRAAAEKYITQLGEDVINGSAMTRIKVDRLCRAALPVVEDLCEEFALSAFEPRFFELSIGEDEDSPEPIHIKADSGPVTIYGVIDRVDAYKKGADVYVRVVDYKTGHKDFSPNDMAEGSNLQMFLYLKALVESENERFLRRLDLGEDGKVLPAGVIYVKTSVRDVKIDVPDDRVASDAVKSVQQREGMVLNDPVVTSAMTLRYSPLYSKRSPTKVDKTKEKFRYTADGWKAIMKTVEDSVCRVADGIRSGVMDATPNDSKGRQPCEYCEFKPICRHEGIKRPFKR